MTEFLFLTDFLRFLLSQVALLMTLFVVFSLKRLNIIKKGRFCLLLGIFMLLLEGVGPIMVTMFLTMKSIDVMLQSEWIFRVLTLSGWIGATLVIMGMIFAVRELKSMRKDNNRGQTTEGKPGTDHD